MTKNQVPGVTAIISVFLGLALIGMATLIVAAFVPSIGTIRLMGLGTLFLSVYLMFLGLYCIVLAFLSLTIKAAPGNIAIEINAFFAAAKAMTDQMAVVFLLSGVVIIASDVYLMTTVVIKQDPTWHSYDSSKKPPTDNFPDEKKPPPADFEKLKNLNKGDTK